MCAYRYNFIEDGKLRLNFGSDEIHIKGTAAGDSSNIITNISNTYKILCVHITSGWKVNAKEWYCTHG